MFALPIKYCLVDCVLDFRGVVFARLEPFQIRQDCIFLGLVRCAVIPTSATAAIIIAAAGQTLIRIANRPQSIFTLRCLDFDKRPIVAVDFRCVRIAANVVGVPLKTKVRCHYCIGISCVVAILVPFLACIIFVNGGTMIKYAVFEITLYLAHNSIFFT